MSKTTYYDKPKRREKLGRDEQLVLMFDLINAFSVVKSPTETALLLRDLLTASEIKNLSKRLRIAKLLLAGETEREIANKLHSSFETIAKVNLWLNQGGEGLRNVIFKLPFKYKIPEKLPPIPIEFQLPKVIAALTQYVVGSKQNSFLDNFAKGVSAKESLKGYFK